MTRTKQHIAYLLLLAFLLPLTLQPLHVLRHHRLNIKYTGHSYSVAYHHQESNTNVKSEACPLCEFQFAINDLPQAPFYRTEIPLRNYVFGSIIPTQEYQRFFPHKSSRAPPISI